MVSDFLLNFLFLLIFCLPYFFLKKFVPKFSHLDIFFGVWIFVLVGIQTVFKIYLPELSTLIVFYIAGSCFLLGSILLISLSKLPISKSYTYDFYKIKVALASIILLSIMANIQYLFLLKSLGIFDSELGLLSLRLPQTRELVYSSSVFSTLFRRSHYIFIPLALYLASNKQISRLTLVAILVFAIIINGMEFTRAPLLSVCIISIISYLIFFTVKRRPLILFTLISIIFLTLFGYITTQIEERVTVDKLTESEFQLYTFGGVKAYENILYNHYNKGKFYNSYYTFDFINYPLKRLGLIDGYPSLEREYSYSPPTNLYSFLDAFTLDFGITGAFIGCFILGIIVSFAYVKSLSKNLAYVIIYSSCCYYVAMSPLNNEFIRFGFVIIIIQALIIDRFIRVRRT